MPQPRFDLPSSSLLFSALLIGAGAVAVSAAPAALPANLHWHTDLDSARADARLTGRPILSLRLLGRLDEQHSCANSRYFRILLYPDPEVNALLADRFVLHWASERPAPRITIDFGDGRVLERTLTGNSVHYVLDAEGRPIDAIPGLWGPAGFAEELRAAEALERSLRELSPSRRLTRLVEAHRTALDACVVMFGDIPIVPRGARGRPRAATAARLAMTKSVPELPVVRRITMISDLGVETEPLRDAWMLSKAFAPLPRVRFSEASQAIMRHLEGPGSGAPGAGPAGDVAAQQAFRSLVSETELSVARDEELNRSLLHASIHEWFTAEDVVAYGGWTLEELNREIYASLFLTPATDPWLGLAPEDGFVGLPRGGLVETAP